MWRANGRNGGKRSPPSATRIFCAACARLLAAGLCWHHELALTASQPHRLHNDDIQFIDNRYPPPPHPSVSTYTMFGIGGMHQSAAAVTSGTGYGGQQGDNKQLIAGRKKAEQASVKVDKANVQFLKTIQKILSSSKKTRTTSKTNVKVSNSKSIDDGDRKKLSAVLADIFRNQVPTDWDRRKNVYNIALEVSHTLAFDETLATIFGDKDSPESVLYWLLDFRNQAKDILKRPMPASGWSKEDHGDVALATQVCSVADAALKISRRCQVQKPVEELCLVTLSERYQSQLGPLRFDTVETLKNVSRYRVLYLYWSFVLLIQYLLEMFETA